MANITKQALKNCHNYIIGKFVESSYGKTFSVYDPSSEEVIAQVAMAFPEDVNQAVEAARAAFDGVLGGKRRL